MSQVVGSTGSCHTQHGSCALERERYFYEGGAVGGINPPIVKCPSHAQQTRCSAFSYADAVRVGRASTLSRKSPPTLSMSFNTKFRGKSTHT